MTEFRFLDISSMISEMEGAIAGGRDTMPGKETLPLLSLAEDVETLAVVGRFGAAFSF